MQTVDNMSLFERTLMFYKEGGLFKLVKAFIKYTRNSRLWELQWKLRLRYYLLRGKRTFSIGGVRTTIRLNQYKDGWESNFAYKTEHLVMEEVLKELKPNDVFWDVGASFGFYSLLAASCASAVVMAFEPHPITVERLAKNIELNRKSNIQILQLALSDSKGKTRFNMIDSDINPGSSHLATDEINGTIEVETSRGDDLIENGTVPKPDIIKIDVEGAEHLVIKGMQSALPSCRVLFCEVHPNIRKYGSSAEDLEKILKNTGFRIEKIQERFDDTYHLKARR